MTKKTPLLSWGIFTGWLLLLFWALWSLITGNSIFTSPRGDALWVLFSVLLITGLFSLKVYLK